jgi:hypothetical protein
MEKPSFRIVDFGRGEHFHDYIRKNVSPQMGKVLDDVTKDFMRMKWREQMAALDAMSLRKRHGCFDYHKGCPVSVW